MAGRVSLRRKITHGCEFAHRMICWDVPPSPRTLFSSAESGVREKRKLRVSDFISKAMTLKLLVSLVLTP